MSKRFFSIGTALAVGCVGLLAVAQASTARGEVSDLEATQIVGGQSGGNCGVTAQSYGTGCNTRTSSWKPWDGCTSGSFVTTSGTPGPNVYTTSNCYSGCGNYCGVVTNNQPCGSTGSSAN